MVNADRPTVVLVHGFLDDAAIWRPVQAILDRRGIPTEAIDLAGQSGSPTEPGPYTLPRYAADVVALVDRVAGPIVLVGQSMGAQVVELAARQRPDRVRGLVLVTPVPLGGTALPAEAVAPFKGLGGSPEAQRRARLGLSVSFPEDELDRLAAVGATIDPDAIPQFVDAWNNGVPEGAGLSTFTGPVRILRGAGDGFCTAELVDAGVAARFAGAEVHAIDGAGHWAHAERPDTVADHLVGFVEVLEGGSANTAEGVDAQGWTTAFEKKTEGAFGEAFVADVRLRATTLYRPVEGVVAVQQVMAAASSLYESLTFTQQATQGRRDYLEWEATAFGGTPISGVTVLTKDEAGRIAEIAIHHRPLQAALTFSEALGRKLAGVVDAEHFYST
ncbi:alpha/beta hydrolase [Pseudonocardia xishanensis]|uniref:AB hydrolase-1 domain-containing protein n=1 Tax=Pseudonocardia xishanensis TaxID=630995 RepID=A0ABP8RVV0_9PSEU